MTLSDKFKERRKRVNDTCNEYTQAIAHTSFNQIEEDVKAFIKKIKEEDLYRSLITKYGKVKVWNLNPQGMIELIEEYYNTKIDQKAGDKLI